jgi:TonB family protein
MRRSTRLGQLVVCALLLLGSKPYCRAQQDSAESHRKISSKVVPIYPALARDMKIAGSVKIEASVAPNGTVKSAAILGGHPVLAQAGLDAVRKCKWEAAGHETKELVILNFHPE